MLEEIYLTINFTFYKSKYLRLLFKIIFDLFSNSYLMQFLFYKLLGQKYKLMALSKIIFYTL